MPQEVLEENPFTMLDSPRRGRPLPHVLNVDEVERLLKAPAQYWRNAKATPAKIRGSAEFCTARDTAILEVIYSGGLRISEAINLFGPVADLLDTRAMVRMANQDFKAAVNDLNLALDDGPTNTRYFHLALAYEGDKKLNLARENFRRAQEMGLTVDSVTDLERKSFRRMMQKYGQVIQFLHK